MHYKLHIYCKYHIKASVIFLLKVFTVIQKFGDLQLKVAWNKSWGHLATNLTRFSDQSSFEIIIKDAERSFFSLKVTEIKIQIRKTHLRLLKWTLPLPVLFKLEQKCSHLSWQIMQIHPFIHGTFDLWHIKGWKHATKLHIQIIESWF